MIVRTWVDTLRRKLFGAYKLDDPRSIASLSPYTFYLPPSSRLNAIDIGDRVKLIFRRLPAARKEYAERMWVLVREIDGDTLVGSLNNKPVDMPQMKLGDIIEFKLWHVIDTDWQDPEKEKTIPPETSKQVWERCIADHEILNGTARVGFLYREEPDISTKDDEHPDSGWRIRADHTQLTDEQYENPSPKYIAIGKVLNKDDSWIHLIRAPIGSQYLRNEETGEFEEVEL